MKRVLVVLLVSGFVANEAVGAVKQVASVPRGSKGYALSSGMSAYVADVSGAGYTYVSCPACPTCAPIADTIALLQKLVTQVPATYKPAVLTQIQILGMYK